MSNEILYILLPNYAAHEIVYLAQAIASDEYALKENPKYANKVVAPSLEPIKSIGGFRTVPDYSFDTMPDDYAALVLIGGFGWATPIAEQVVPIVRQAIEKGKIVGAICNGVSFMAKCGFLNAVRHTGNGLEQLKLWGGENYTNQDGYIHTQAVSDRNIVTANGSATLEFAKELLLLLENDTPDRIEMYYQFNKQGFCDLQSAMESRKVIITWIAVTVVVMFALPFAVARLASECSGMALCIILFFTVNPIYSAILGYRCGKDIRRMWNLPLVSSIAFLAGTWLFFDIREVWFIVYASVYLIIGWTTMGISKYLSK